MFTILSHKGNINQNYPKILSYPVRLTIIKKKSTTNAGENVGKGTLTHCWWECKLVQPLWQSVGVSSKS
jgi:hypothetical protein